MEPGKITFSIRDHKKITDDYPITVLNLEEVSLIATDIDLNLATSKMANKV